MPVTIGRFGIEPGARGAKSFINRNHEKIGNSALSRGGMATYPGMPAAGAIQPQHHTATAAAATFSRVSITIASVGFS